VDRASVPQVAPLRNRAFRVFLFGHFVSLVGDQLYFLALPWAAIQAGASGAVVGLLLAVAAAPRAVLMLGGGVVVDRLGGRRVMLASDALRGVVTLAAAVAAFAGIGGLVGLFVVAAFFGAVDAFFHPARGAFLPALVRREQLPAANGLRTLAVRVAEFVGPPLSGLVLAAGGLGWVFLLDAATFVVSFAAVRAIAVDAAAGAPTARGARVGSFWGELAGGLRYAAGNRFLAALLVFSTLANAGFTGPTNVGLPLLARQAGWGAAGLGLVLGALGAGAATGAALLGFGLLPGAGTGRLLLAATAGQALCTALTPYAGGLPTTAAVQAGMGFALTVAGSSAFSLLQAGTDPDKLGRATSLMFLATMGLTPVTYAAAGTLANSAGPHPLFLTGALIQAVSVVLGASSARLRTAHLPTAPHRPSPWGGARRS